MAVTVTFSYEPATLLDLAGKFLASQPVVHNLVLTLLEHRAAHPEPGRYWIALDGDEVLGVVMKSPTDVPATLTPMREEALIAVVEALRWVRNVFRPGAISRGRGCTEDAHR